MLKKFTTPIFFEADAGPQAEGASLPEATRTQLEAASRIRTTQAMQETTPQKGKGPRTKLQDGSQGSPQTSGTTTW